MSKFYWENSIFFLFFLALNGKFWISKWDYWLQITLLKNENFITFLKTKTQIHNLKWGDGVEKKKKNHNVETSFLKAHHNPYVNKIISTFSIWEIKDISWNGMD